MKNFNYLPTILLLISLFFSCNEKEWLEEKPFDFYTTNNSYTNPAQFNSAVARLYELTDNNVQWSDVDGNFIYFYTSDMAYNSVGPTYALSINSYADQIIPENASIRFIWRDYYQTIFQANAIIDRIDDDNVDFSSEVERNSLKGEALFFRAYSYKNLGILFGGVPIVIEETNAPKRDFVRETREAVIKQAIIDAEFAAANLPHVTELKEDGRLSKAAANHLLSELYIIMRDWDKAISAASSVINDPNYALMTNRFGVHKNWAGDVYWDLFRGGNQNRNGKGGLNTESIWVAQYEYMVSGGGKSKALARHLGPRYWQLVGPDRRGLFFGPSSQNGGRGIGWMSPTDYFYNLWENDTNDIRNSEYNIIRDLVADNPNSAYYGKKIVESGAIIGNLNLYNRDWRPLIGKAAPYNDFPAELILNPVTGQVRNEAGNTYRDHYYYRLAETYLLRAEAYLGKGDNVNATSDINVVRSRANAKPAEISEVNIDYILDERARELYFEELRILTLMRLGKLVERVKLYDPYHNGKYTTFGIGDHQNVWPIPQSEIERNTEAVLEQNPGYN